MNGKVTTPWYAFRAAKDGTMLNGQRKMCKVMHLGKNHKYLFTLITHKVAVNKQTMDSIQVFLRKYYIIIVQWY